MGNRSDPGPILDDRTSARPKEKGEQREISVSEDERAQRAISELSGHHALLVRSTPCPGAGSDDEATVSEEERAERAVSRPFSLGRSPAVSSVSSDSSRSSTRNPFKDPKENCDQRRELPRLPRFTDRTSIHRALGMTVDEHGFSDCPLPGHHGVAVLVPLGENGELRLDCDCLGRESRFPGDESVSGYDRHLADVYQAIHTGQVIERGHQVTKPQRAYWRMVLARDVGLLQPVDLPTLPPGADDDLRRGRELFALLCARSPGGQTEFARGLVERSLGIDRDAARRVIDGLREAKVIELHHREPPVGRQKYGVSVFNPGGHQ